MIKVTTPQQMNALVDDHVIEAINKFEQQFLREEKGQKYYHLVIVGEYIRAVCDKVEEQYRTAGWIAKCRTSSENGERPGLTGLILESPK